MNIEYLRVPGLRAGSSVYIVRTKVYTAKEEVDGGLRLRCCQVQAQNALTQRFECLEVEIIFMSIIGVHEQGGFLHFIWVVETQSVSVSASAVTARLDGSTKVGFTTQFVVPHVDNVLGFAIQVTGDLQFK